MGTLRRKSFQRRDQESFSIPRKGQLEYVAVIGNSKAPQNNGNHECRGILSKREPSC